MKLQLLVLMFFVSFAGFAQVGIGTTTPDASSALDITATDKGFLMPRMTTVQKDAIVSPAEGLQVYDTDTKSVWTYDLTAWKEGVGGAGKFVDGATPEIAYYQDKVGIGRNNFGNSHKLWVEGNKDTDGTNTATKIVANYNGTGASAATFGLATEANNTSSGTITSASGTLSAVNNSAGGTISSAIASWGYIINNGTIPYGLGALGIIYNQAGGITTGIGSQGSIDNSSGATIDNAYLGDFSVANEGTITNLYGAYFEYYGSSTTTNSYAIYIDSNFNAGTADNFAVFSETEAASVFVGNVGFGDFIDDQGDPNDLTEPLQTVHVNGVMRLEPQGAPPTGGLGDLYVGTDNKLYFHNGTDWKEVQLVP